MHHKEIGPVISKHIYLTPGHDKLINLWHVQNDILPCLALDKQVQFMSHHSEIEPDAGARYYM